MLRYTGCQRLFFLTRRREGEEGEKITFPFSSHLVLSHFKTICAYYGFLASKETVVLRQRESETKIEFYQRS